MHEIHRFVVGFLRTNCYLIYEGTGSGKGFLIDPGCPDDRISRFIKENKIDVVSVLNTHGHIDHVGGDSSFSAPVMIHELDAFYVSDVKKLEFLKDGDVLEAGSIRMSVMHTPGHTPGGVSLRCGSVVFTGDTLFHESVGRTDLPGGSHLALVESIRKKLFVLPDDTVVYPGHGPETTIGHEKASNPFL